MELNYTRLLKLNYFVFSLQVWWQDQNQIQKDHENVETFTGTHALLIIIYAIASTGYFAERGGVQLFFTGPCFVCRLHANCVILYWAWNMLCPSVSHFALSIQVEQDPKCGRRIQMKQQGELMVLWGKLDLKKWISETTFIKYSNYLKQMGNIKYNNKTTAYFAYSHR